MKVLLLNPPRIHSVWCGVPDIFNGRDQHLFPPLGAMYLSAWLKAHTSHEVKIMDPNAYDTSDAAIESEITAYGPDFVGITALTHNVYDVSRMASLAHRINPDCHVMLGGPHAFEFPDEAIQLKDVDSIMTAMDPEALLGQWLDALTKRGGYDTVPGVRYKDRDGTVRDNPAPPPAKNLDHLPFPDRTTLDLTRFYTPGMAGRTTTTAVTTRGCPQGCHFCLSSRAFRVRSTESMVDEMIECQKMGIEEIQYVDDIFNAPVKRITALSDAILARKLKMAWGFKATVNSCTHEMLEKAREAGCVKTHWGVETGTEDGLKSIGKSFAALEDSRRVFKWCKELGIKSCAYIMIGIPWEKTRDDVMRTVEFIHELDPTYVVYAIMSPYPGTPLWKKGAEMGLWDEALWRRFLVNPTAEHDHLPTTWPEHMAKEELFKIFKEVNREFYFNPRKVLQTLREIQSFSELKRIFLGGVGLLRLQFVNPEKSI